MEYLGGSFSSVYNIQSIQVRFGIKEALKSEQVVNINPFNLIATEVDQDLQKVQDIIDNFSQVEFYKKPIQVFNWGCGMLIMNGHHRSIVAQQLNINPLVVLMSRYPLC